MALGIKSLSRNGSAPTAQTPEQPVEQPPKLSKRARPPKQPARNRNRGWMAAGAALILIAGVSAASIASSLSQSVDVLVASRPIAKGAVIGANDYRSVSIAADTGSIEAIAPTDAEKLIGQLASGPIGQGSILHPDQFTNRADQEVERTVVLGALLGANNLPVLDLLPGDRVRLFETFSGSASTSVSLNTTGGGEGVAREITDGDIVRSSNLSTGGSRHVSIRLNESNANIVANLVTQGRLSLVLVESLPSTDEVAPLEPAEPLPPGAPGDAEEVGDDS